MEATKYTEVGYVGKDVSSIIQDKYLYNPKFSKDRYQQLQEQAGEGLQGAQREGQAGSRTADPARHGRRQSSPGAEGEEAAGLEEGLL